MNHKYRQYISAAMVLALSTGIPVTYNFIQPALAQEIGEAPGKVLQQLNLSNDQIQQIKAIRSRNNSEIRTSRQRLRQLQNEMQDLMSGTAPGDQIRAKFNELQSVQQQVSKLRFEQMLAMREVLTPQQRSQLAQLMKQRKDTRRERLR